MSLFFLVLTVLTLVIGHSWATHNRPTKPTSFDLIKKYHGSLNEFTDQLSKAIKEHPEWLLLERTRTRFVISESPSLFQFGCFYHIHIEQSEEGLIVHVKTQPKLVGPQTSNSGLNKHLLQKLGLKNVS